MSGGAGRQGGSKAPGGRSWALRPAPVRSQGGERGLGAARSREAHGSERAASLPCDRSIPELFPSQSGAGRRVGSEWASQKVARVGPEQGASKVLGELEADPRAGGRWGGERSQAHSSFASGGFCNC